MPPALLKRAPMTVLLCIIGITAVVWPVFVASFFEKEANSAIQNSFSRYGGMYQNLEEQTAGKIQSLEKTVEQQDAIIAALWQKTFGFVVTDKYSSPELPQHLGVKPQWSAHIGEWAGPVQYLVRYDPYPWGTHAKHLVFSGSLSLS